MTERSILATIAAVALLALAIGAVVLVGPLGLDGNGSASTTTEGTPAPTVPDTPSTDESPSTTTTTLPTTTPTAGAEWEDGRYRVVGVADDDVLNVRESPDPSAPIVGTLPPDGRVMLDGFSAMIGSARWLSVTLDDGAIGWVNGAFLASPPGWDVPFDITPCTPDGPGFDDTHRASGEDLAPGAGNVLDVFVHERAECSRIVLVLGEGAGLDGAGMWSSGPAATVPAGTSVSSGGPIVEIRIPRVGQVRPLAQTTETDFGFVLATRDEPSGDALSDLTFRAFFDSNRRASVEWLDEPARVVIDVRAGPTGSGLDVAAKRARTTVVLPIQVDVDGPGVSTPIEVSGWARPFEAQGIAILREATSDPGAGALVEATFSGTDFVGTQATAEYPFSTTDWIDAWGAFSFTIDDLPLGSYELFVGDFDMESGEPEGVYQTFTVGG